MYMCREDMGPTPPASPASTVEVTPTASPVTTSVARPLPSLATYDALDRHVEGMLELVLEGDAVGVEQLLSQVLHTGSAVSLTLLKSNAVQWCNTIITLEDIMNGGGN